MWHGSDGQHSGRGGAGADENCNSWTSSSSKLTGRASLFRHQQLAGAQGHPKGMAEEEPDEESREWLLISCDSADMAFLCVHLTHTPSE